MATPDEAIGVLNRALSADRDAMRALFSTRIACNKALADDPTIQVLKEPDGSLSVGPMGLLNGLFGIRDDRFGHICAVWSDDGKLLRFEPMKDLP